MNKFALRTATIIAEGLTIGLIARINNLWPIALVIVTVLELLPLRRKLSAEVLTGLVPTLITDWSVTLLVAMLPRALSQFALAALFTAGRLWLEHITLDGQAELAVALVSQFLAFWAIFVTAAIWHWPRLVVIVAVWLICFVPTRLLLARRNDPAKSVIAATWALVAAEISWVCLNWLVSYVVVGSLLIIPQPAIVLTGLAYCFGSIYLSQREGKLSRRRLSEYVVIVAAIIAVVAAGTNWHGTI